MLESCALYMRGVCTRCALVSKEHATMYKAHEISKLIARFVCFVHASLLQGMWWQVSRCGRHEQVFVPVVGGGVWKNGRMREFNGGRQVAAQIKAAYFRKLLVSCIVVILVTLHLQLILLYYDLTLLCSHTLPVSWVSCSHAVRRTLAVKPSTMPYLDRGKVEQQKRE
jgi:hypothetical protein